MKPIFLEMCDRVEHIAGNELAYQPGGGRAQFYEDVIVLCNLVRVATALTDKDLYLPHYDTILDDILEARVK